MPKAQLFISTCFVDLLKKVSASIINKYRSLSVYI